MLPYTPLHYLLVQGHFTALIMTSGNLSEEPIAIDNADAFARLGDIADYFLVHDRDIYLRSDDSVLRMVDGRQRLIIAPGFCMKPYDEARQESLCPAGHFNHDCRVFDEPAMLPADRARWPGG